MARTAFRSGTLVALLTFALTAVATGADDRDDCDRACLEGLVDDYLTALQARDPSGLPLAAHYKFTENAVRLALGDGFWQTVDPGSFKPAKLYAADPASGQAIFYGGATENGHGVLFSMRVRHFRRQLTEIETMVVRRSPAVFGEWDKLPMPDPIWAQPLTSSERSSRDAMIYAANHYFEGIEQGNGDIVPMEDEAVRVEHGVQTAPFRPGSSRPPMKIRDAMSNGRYGYITDISHRRFVVDEERGIAVALINFHRPGNVRTAAVDWENARKNPNSVLAYPNTTLMFEAFKVRNGRIAHIYADFVLLQYRQEPGWQVPPNPAWPIAPP